MIIFVIALGLLGVSEEPGQNRIDFFEKKIRPVLAERYCQCHWAEAARSGMLQTDEKGTVTFAAFSRP